MPRHLRPDATFSEQWHELRSDYDAAHTSRHRRTRSGVPLSGANADYHLRSEQGWLRMLEWSRDVCRNDPLVSQGIKRLVNNCLQGGLGLDPNTDDKGLDEEIKARWEEWSTNADACDVAGEHTFAKLERFALRQQVADGDIFANLTNQGKIEMIEAHRVRTPQTAKDKRRKTPVVVGVEMDEYRRRKRFWVTKDEVEPSQPVKRVTEMRQLPVRDRNGDRIVCHVYDPARVSLSRGVTALAPACWIVDQTDDLMFAQLVKAKTAASYAILHEYPLQSLPAGLGADQRGAETETTRSDGSTQTTQGIGPGIEFFGQRGETLKGFSPNVPNQEFFDHINLLLGIIAVNLDLPLLVFVLDSTKSNFSAWRGALDEARRTFRELQRNLSERFHSPVYRWKLRRWALDDPAIGRAFQLYQQNNRTERWLFEGWSYIEPNKDATADGFRLGNSMVSGRRWAAERGIDWDIHVVEVVEDRSKLIRRAIEEAEAINAEHANADVSWRDIAGLPTPDGVSISVTPEAETAPGAERDQQPKKPRVAA